MFAKMFAKFVQILADKKGDEFAQKAVILVFVVLAGVAALTALGLKIAGTIDQTTGAI